MIKVVHKNFFNCGSYHSIIGRIFVAPELIAILMMNESSFLMKNKEIKRSGQEKGSELNKRWVLNANYLTASFRRAIKTIKQSADHLRIANFSFKIK